MMIGPKSKLSKKTIALVITLLVSVSIAATYFGLAYLNQPPCPSGTNLRSFLIISSSNGFNDSKDHPLTLTAQKNDCVLITVENTDIQAHGLAVQTYDPHGIVVRPGETKSARFYAASTGQFTIWEPVLSTIYILDKGLLNVTSA